MLRKLKKHFPSLRYYEKAPSEIDPNLTWFMTENGQVIGIHPSEISEKDLTLLQMFLEPYEHLFPTMSPEEMQWKQFIHEEGDTPQADDMYRFIYFKISADQLQPITFKEAINELYEKNVIIIWESQTEGVIVDMKDKADEFLSFEEIIDVLMSDLYSNVKFFVGPYLSKFGQAKHHYQRLVAEANTAFSYSESNVVSYIEAIPFMLTKQMPTDLKNELQHLILQEFQDDKVFIHMIEVLLKSNLNISEAAKKLYMHRNSLQYRIEKFNNKTGLDIRKFYHALTVYLALLTKKLDS